MNEGTYGQSDAGACSALFIGGLADGKRMKDPGQQYWKVAGDMPVPRYNTVPMHPVEITRNEATYRREKLTAAGKVWIIYVLDSLTIAQAMGKLVSGYSPENA